MTPTPLRAVAIDTDTRALGTLAHNLTHRGYRLVARPAPAESLEYVRKVRPEIVLLGAAWWRDGWPEALRRASPRSVLLPIDPAALERWDAPTGHGAA
jgi:DNA-binding response OmpR family regulator